MNKIGKIVGCLLLLVPVGVVGQKPQKVSDHLKTIEVNYVGVDELRTLQYKPDGQDFVCINGNNRYTRALYGSPTEDRIETSDRPVFVAYKAKDSRNISFSLTTDGVMVELDKTDFCEARYTAGRRTYKLTDHRWGKGIIYISVLAFPDRQGGIWKIQTENFTGTVQLTARVCEIQNQNLRRWGDMGAEVPGSLEAASSPKQLQTVTWNGKNNLSYAIIEGQVFYAATVADETLFNTYSSYYEQAEAHRSRLASMVEFHTPDPYINTLGGVLVTAGDGSWDGDTFLHGAIGWHSPLPGWRAAYMGDFLGWNDRAKRHFSAYAESQVTNVPNTIPHPTQDSLNNLCRAVKEWGTPMYSNGYICRAPHRNDVMHHYDMNLNYIDELLWHFQFDADTAYMRKMWPVLERHLKWEKLNFDPNDDGLYDAYCCIWASDALYYNSGAVTHSSAYNYRGNLVAARIAEILGYDPASYRAEAEKILKAMNQSLWMDDKGCWAEYRDFMGLKRLHTSAALWSVYTPIDSYSCSPEQAYRATQYVDNCIPHIPIRIEGEETPRYYVLSTTNWLPYSWSINNVAPAETMHTALAYFHAGRPNEAFRIMKGVLLDGMYLGGSPGNIGQVSAYDAARGETYRDFSDNVGVTAKAAVQGLFGISPDALHGRCVIRPGFPSSWDSAFIRTPYIEYTFKRVGNQEIYDIKQNFARPLQIVIRQNTAKGQYKESVFTNDKHQHIVLDAVAHVEEPEADMYAWMRKDPMINKDMGTDFDEVRTAQCRPVDMTRYFNAEVTDIFKNEYVSPASPYTTLRIPKNGFGEWCHPLFYAETNDSVFRSQVDNGIFKACLDDTKTIIPFRSVAEGRNIAYTSLWNNYPDSLTLPLKGKASHAYLMLAGTTNHMQSRIANGRITISYTDGSKEIMELVNPYNWCPIEQDYYIDKYAFYVTSKRPYRVHLMSGLVSRNLGNQLNIEDVYGREIPGGAGQLLDIKLDSRKELKELTLTTLSNDVVIGLMGITLQL